MSSILKALKKVEAEKVSRSDAPVDIARDILRQSGRGSGTGFRLLLLTFFALVAAAGIIVLLLSEIGEKTEGPSRAASPAGEGIINPGVEDLQPASAARDNTPRSSGTENLLSDKDIRPESSGVFETHLLAPDAAASEPTPLKRIPALIVTGIAYQQDREGRLAVVNELPVMEGTLIEGARIEEILEDRVRFVKDGRTFEVGLGNPGEELY
jgi:general secretion pathway protein B